MAKKYHSKVLGTMHRMIADMHEVGVVDKTTMREFDRMCLTVAEPMTPAEIRESTGVSQAVFAEHLGDRQTRGGSARRACGARRSRPACTGTRAP